MFEEKKNWQLFDRIKVFLCGPLKKKIATLIYIFLSLYSSKAVK